MVRAGRLKPSKLLGVAIHQQENSTAELEFCLGTLCISPHLAFPFVKEVGANGS
jgi:hypothetical protein